MHSSLRSIFLLCALIYFSDCIFVGGQYYWSKSYGNRSVSSVCNIVPANDGGFVAAGTIYINDQEEHYAWVIKLNYKGDIVWQKTYGDNGNRAVSILAASDSGFFLFGGKTYYGLWVIKINSDGKVLWGRVMQILPLMDQVSIQPRMAD